MKCSALGTSRRSSTPRTRMHQGSRNSASRNTAPVSSTARSTCDSASMHPPAASRARDPDARRRRRRPFRRDWRHGKYEGVIMADQARELVVLMTRGTDHELSSVGFTIANGGMTAGLKVLIFLTSAAVDLVR